MQLIQWIKMLLWWENKKCKNTNITLTLYLNRIINQTIPIAIHAIPKNGCDFISCKTPRIIINIETMDWTINWFLPIFFITPPLLILLNHQRIILARDIYKIQIINLSKMIEKGKLWSLRFGWMDIDSKCS